MTKAQQFRKHFGSPSLPPPTGTAKFVYGRWKPRYCQPVHLEVHCDGCGARNEVMHSPVNKRGFWCAKCCPVCAADKAKAAGATVVGTVNVRIAAK